MENPVILEADQSVGPLSRYAGGTGCYVADIASRLHGAALVVVRSDLPHARLRGVGLEEVRPAPGVLAAFSAEDIRADLGAVPVITPRISPSPVVIPFLQPVLATDRVRYVGEPVAVVVAEDRYLAEDAAALIDLDLEPLPAVLDNRTASTSDRLFDASNEIARLESGFGDLEAAFAAADAVDTFTLTVGRHSGVPMETRGLVAEPHATGGLTVYGAAKVVHANRAILAAMLEVSLPSIRMVEVDVGGGFGIRGEFYPEDFLVPWAARRLGRTVSWVEDRREHLIAANQSRDQVHDVSIASSADGRLLAISTECWIDSGAYVRTVGLRVAELTLGEIPGPYRFAAYSGIAHCAVTNRTPTGTYRSPGRFEASFVRERMIDRMAARLRLPPDELRRKNLVRIADMPYRPGLRSAGKELVLDSGDYVALFERVSRRTAACAAEAAADASDTDRVGHATACFIEKSGLGPFEDAILEVGRTGTIDVLTGASYLGQGLNIALTTVVAEALELPATSVRILRVDTDRIDAGVGTYASRSMTMSGGAVANACEELLRLGREAAADELEISADDLAYRAGVFVARDAPSIGISLGDLAGRRADRSGSDVGLSARARYEKDSVTYGFGTHGAVVTTNARTGLTRVTHLVLGYDAGRVIDRDVVVGQLEGAAVQAIGGALLEHFSFDSIGNPLATTFMDYLMPTASDAPHMEVILAASPPNDNPLGVRGAGEAGIPAIAAAIAKAIECALDRDPALASTPITPEAVWRLANGLSADRAHLEHDVLSHES